MPGKCWSAVYRIAIMDWKRWIRSSRLIVCGILLIFIQIQIIDPMQEAATLMNSKLSVMEPFTALGNSGVIVLILPILFLVLMAGFPQKDDIELFYLICCDKRVWVWGQLLLAILISAVLILSLLVLSAIMLGGSGEWNPDYSVTITQFTAVYPERSGSYVVQLIPENLYNHMSLSSAVLHTGLLLFLYFMLLAMILLLSALINQRLYGILMDGALILLGTVGCAMRTGWMWGFPMAHTIPWLHYTAYLRKPVFPLSGSYFYFLILDLLLFFACMLAAKHYQPGRKG